ncbi:MAG TPA: four helix bundle protein [Bacteroidales bacterium]|nr:four helix bundle protein [Bacteroidales bacterium]HSA42056.1 four helix bundle protein [Bacteroidales bacterium]
MRVYSFEKLIVWQNVRQLVTEIYNVSTSFPKFEEYGLVSQIRRSVVSISSNIAEGSSRNSAKEQSHFYHIAYGSTVELLSQLILCADLKYITDKQLHTLREMLENITSQLNALHQSTSKQ